MRGERGERLAIGQHPAPAGRRRLGAKANVRQRRLGQNGERELDRGLNDQQVGDIGQDMFGRYPHPPLARHPRGQNEIARPKFERCAA